MLAFPSSLSLFALRPLEIISTATRCQINHVQNCIANSLPGTCSSIRDSNTWRHFQQSADEENIALNLLENCAFGFFVRQVLQLIPILINKVVVKHHVSHSLILSLAASCALHFQRHWIWIVGRALGMGMQEVANNCDDGTMNKMNSNNFQSTRESADYNLSRCGRLAFHLTRTIFSIW